MRPLAASNGSDHRRSVSVFVTKASFVPSGDGTISPSCPMPVVRRSGPDTQRERRGIDADPPDIQDAFRPAREVQRVAARGPPVAAEAEHGLPERAFDVGRQRRTNRRTARNRQREESALPRRGPPANEIRAPSGCQTIASIARNLPSTSSRIRCGGVPSSPTRYTGGTTQRGVRQLRPDDEHELRLLRRPLRASKPNGGQPASRDRRARERRRCLRRRAPIETPACSRRPTTTAANRSRGRS